MSKVYGHDLYPSIHTAQMEHESTRVGLVVTNIPSGFVAIDETNNVYKKLITPGTGIAANRTGSTVKVHYTGSLFSNGDIFDSSLDRGDPISFKIGQGQVVKGWDVGIASMNVGEHAELLIQPEYGYGKQGSPPKIPGDSVLLFKVELVDVDVSTAEMTIEEKIANANEAKELGNAAFKNGEFEKALSHYKKGADCLQSTWGAEPDQGRIITDLKISLHSNLAAVCLKTKDASKAAEYSQKVLDIDENHAKGIFRLFQANLMLGKLQEGIELLENKRQFLSDVNVDQEILKAKKIKAQQLANEKKMYSKMFA